MHVYVTETMFIGWIHKY